MMHGEFNPDIFCRVIEQILNERDENTVFRVTLITEEEAEDIRKRQDKTA
jgi:hypothetical protein